MEKMIKMTSPTKPKGDFKLYKESDVAEAKANGWEEVVSKPKAKKVKKDKGDK